MTEMGRSGRRQRWQGRERRESRAGRILHGRDVRSGNGATNWQRSWRRP